MIAFVRGKIFSLVPGRVAVDTGSGVIIQLIMPVSSFSQLKENQEVMIHTVLKIKDENMFLYGFLQSREKIFFEKLISVSGIGAKIAMACISAFPPDEWIIAIESGDVAKISSIPGIGKKTAQRIILELTGKLELEKETAGESVQLSGYLISGLSNLGFPPKAIRETVSRVLKENPGLTDFEELFKILLKKMKL
jgi:Holliday junction DNA helicase RuvA